MKRTCPSCGIECPPAKYLCWNCWWSLNTPARIALKRTDARAMQRLKELLEAINAGTPLNLIRITP